jgi:AcrR family transcriptional regulator
MATRIQPSRAEKLPKSKRAPRRNRATAHISRHADARQPRQSRAQATVEAIADAAGQLLVESGYAKATTNAIAARAGVSIGSLYQYFRNKDAVFSRLTQRHHQRVEPLLEDLVRALAQPRCNIAQQVGRFVEALMRIHEPERELIRAIDTELGWQEFDSPTGTVQHQQWIDSVVVVLRRARRPSVPDPEASAYLLVTTMELVARQLAHSAPANLDRVQLIDGVVRMVDGLLGQPRALLQHRRATK